MPTTAVPQNYVWDDCSVIPPSAINPTGPDGQMTVITDAASYVTTGGRLMDSSAITTDGTTITAGGFFGPVTVTANTGTATPAAANSRTVYTNEGDTNGSVITLPTAVTGYQFTVVVQAAQTITVTAAAGDTIRIAGSVTAAAGSITSAVVGSSVTLTAINATEWVATEAVGTWSF